MMTTWPKCLWQKTLMMRRPCWWGQEGTTTLLQLEQAGRAVTQEFRPARVRFQRGLDQACELVRHVVRRSARGDLPWTELSWPDDASPMVAPSPPRRRPGPTSW